MNYTIDKALTKAKAVSNVKGNEIIVTGNPGIGTWGALDYLKGHGYIVKVGVK